jgi:hypothetical protein
MMPPPRSGVHDPSLVLSSDHVRVAKRRIAAFGVDYLRHVPGQPFVSMPAPINFLGYAVALAGAGAFAVAVFRGRGRTPYDLVSGTMVVEIPRDLPHRVAKT